MRAIWILRLLPLVARVWGCVAIGDGFPVEHGWEAGITWEGMDVAAAAAYEGCLYVLFGASLSFALARASSVESRRNLRSLTVFAWLPLGLTEEGVPLRQFPEGILPAMRGCCFFLALLVCHSLHSGCLCVEQAGLEH